MAKSSFLGLCQATRRECRITGTGPAAVTNQSGLLLKIVNWVADSAYETESRWHDWDFMWYDGWSSATIANTKAVAAPSDLGVWDEDSFWLNYTLSTNKKLSVLDYKEWRRDLRNGIRASKKPDSVVILPDQSLILEPPPDGIYSLTADYWKRPTKMSANTDVSMIPQDYERIIIARAKMFYGEIEGAGVILESAQIEYDDLLDKLESKYLPGQKGRRRAEAPMMVVQPE